MDHREFACGAMSEPVILRGRDLIEGGEPREHCNPMGCSLSHLRLRDDLGVAGGVPRLSILSKGTTMHLNFIAETSSDGVIDRSFTIGEVSGVLWSPESTTGAPLLLMGHGGGLHKRAPGLTVRARQAVVRDGFHVAAIDAPGHGDRERSRQDQQWVDALLDAREKGEPLTPIIAPFNDSLAERAVPEWRMTIDALQSLPEIGTAAPIGYSGMTTASAIGIPLAVAEPRIRAAIFGGVFVYDAIVEAARRVTIPIEFLLPWDDPEIDRESGLALFDAFASQDKTLHAFPGSHFHVPTDRIDTRFFARQLGATPRAEAIRNEPTKAKRPVSDETGHPGLVAGAGFEPTTSGL
jgi:pimeloyl-ACP methyl ester carboxylesterase